MRVITGKARGRTLLGPKTNEIRPALDSVKEAIFNILGNIEELNILDLFAGTGSVGIEALSRGAKAATFVDRLPEAVQLIHKNLELTHFNGQVIKSDVPRALETLGRKKILFDLIFVDPPYDKNFVTRTLKLILRYKLLAANGLIIIEHSPRETLPENLDLEILSARKYGQTRVSFLKLKGDSV